jgi:hypothetical protein
MTADQIIQLLDQLQERLNGPARYVFDLAVRQVIIEGIVPWLMLVPVLIGFAVMVITARKALRAEKETGSFSSDSDRIFFISMGTIVGLVFTGGGTFLTLIFAIASLPNLLNPEWAALARIINTIKP